MKVEIVDHIPHKFKKGDLVKHINGKIGLIYNTVVTPALGIVILSDLQDENITNNNFNIVVSWVSTDCTLFHGEIKLTQ